jgi:phosphoribosylanthranilate isomerase
VSVDVKICGISDAVAMQATVAAGARYVGLVFYPPSPRAVTIEAARQLAALVPASVTPVGLFVDPNDDDLRYVLASVPLQIIQLHGDETPERVTTVRKLTGLPVMKAVKITTTADVAKARSYESAADLLLFDAHAPGAALPGGNARAFDWSLLHGQSFAEPWMLAGGLNAGNLAEAVRITGAKIVDISSGVEDAPGRKSPDKIRGFLGLAKRL